MVDAGVALCDIDEDAVDELDEIFALRIRTRRSRDARTWRWAITTNSKITSAARKAEFLQHRNPRPLG